MPARRWSRLAPSCNSLLSTKMSSASAEDIFCMKRGVGNAKCEVVVSPSVMIKRRVAAANALRTLAVIPHPLGPSTGGQWPLTMRHEPRQSIHILRAPRPAVLRNMVKGNIAKQPVIPTKRQRVEGSTHRFDHIADGTCVDPSTRLRSLRMTWAGSSAKEQHS